MKRMLLGFVILLGATGMFTPIRAAQGNGKVILSLSGRGPLYFEGAITYFRVRPSGDSKWIEKSLKNQSESFSLAAGEYEIESYVRPCDGNCGLLDPPTDRCQTTFRLKAGETLYAVRMQSNEGKCTLAVSHDSPDGKK